VGNHFHDRRQSQSYADEALEIEEDSSLRRTKFEEPRLRYDVEVVTKLIVYWGTGFLVLSTDDPNCRHRIFERRYTTGCISVFGVIRDIGIE
jgi:hypothetical protein